MLARNGFFFSKILHVLPIKKELVILLFKFKRRKIYLFFVQFMKLNSILSSFKGPFWRKAQILPHCIVEQSICFADNSNFLFLNQFDISK